MVLLQSKGSFENETNYLYASIYETIKRDLLNSFGQIIWDESQKETFIENDTFKNNKNQNEELRAESKVPFVAKSPQTTSSSYWGIDCISFYNGSSNIHEFFESIDTVGILNGLSDIQKISIAKLKLRGIAKRYYESDSQLKLSTISWKLFKDTFIQLFERSSLSVQFEIDFRNCKQHKNETVRDYVIRLRIAANRTVTYGSDEHENAILTKILEKSMLTQFLNGLIKSLKYKVMSSDPKTFKDAIATANREELLLQHFQKDSQQIRVSTRKNKNCFKNAHCERGYQNNNRSMKINVSERYRSNKNHYRPRQSNEFRTQQSNQIRSGRNVRTSDFRTRQSNNVRAERINSEVKSPNNDETSRVNNNTINNVITEQTIDNEINQWKIYSVRGIKEIKSGNEQRQTIPVKYNSTYGNNNCRTYNPIICFKCKERGHKARVCPFTKCFQCQRYGHIRSDCDQASRTEYKISNYSQTRSETKNTFLAELNGETKRILIDSGSDVSIIKSQNCTQEQLANLKPVTLRDVQGKYIPNLGRTMLEINLGSGEVVKQQFIVVKKLNIDADLLVGLDFLNQQEVILDWGKLVAHIKGISIPLNDKKENIILISETKEIVESNKNKVIIGNILSFANDNHAVSSDNCQMSIPSCTDSETRRTKPVPKTYEPEDETDFIITSSEDNE